MFPRYFKGVFECFIEILRANKGCFMNVSRKFQGYAKSISRYLRKFQRVSSKFQGGVKNCFWEVLRVFCVNFKVVSRVFYRCFMDISCFLGYLKVVRFLTVYFIEGSRCSKEV